MFDISSKYSGAAFALIASLGLSLPVHAQTARDLTVEQAHAYGLAHQQPSSILVQVLLDRADATYAVGDTIHLAVKVNKDAYITVINVGASNNITQLFPNAYQTDNHVSGGQAIEIPAQDSGSQIKVAAPVGAELIQVFASSAPLSVIPVDQLHPQSGIFRSVDGGIGSLERDLSVIESNPPPSFEMTIADQIIKTVNAPVSAATPAIVFVQPSQGGGSPASPVAGGIEKTFPLLLATDKTHYLVGEPMLVAVTSMEPCHLSVFGADQMGRARLLFPSSQMPADLIQGRQTLMISGAASPQSITAIGPGIETLTAACTRDARPTPVPVRSASDVLSSEDKAAVERDLVLLETAGTSSTGFAQLPILVSP